MAVGTAMWGRDTSPGHTEDWNANRTLEMSPPLCLIGRIKTGAGLPHYVLNTFESFGKRLHLFPRMSEIQQCTNEGRCSAQ